MNRPEIIITKEMIDAAQAFVSKTEVHRTKTSNIDTLTGHLGEFVVAQFLYGDWQKHHVGENRGKVDFVEDDIEVKTSAFPFREDLNLLVREDYAAKRSPTYIQVILDIESRQSDIKPGTKAIICGWATSEEVKRAPLKDMGSKLKSGSGGYKCHAIPIGKLQDMTTLIPTIKTNG